jgi:hypothetical protein
MFTTKNAHLLHKKAIALVMEVLPGSVDMDAVYGYYKPYHIEWDNIKILVKIAKPSKKASQERAKWFYSLKEKDRQATDYFILLAVMDNGLKAVYVLPKPLAPTRTITITKLDGNMRYNYFKTDLQGLVGKIKEIQAKLPKLINIYREAKSLKGGL